MRAWLVAAGLVLAAGGEARAFDCSHISMPSTAVVCSSSTLQIIADQREEAYKRALHEATAEKRRALAADQSAWVSAYPGTCGVPQRGPIPIAVSDGVRQCFEAAGRARIAYLNAYGGGIAGGGGVVTEQRMPAEPAQSVGPPVFVPPPSPPPAVQSSPRVASRSSEPTPLPPPKLEPVEADNGEVYAVDLNHIQKGAAGSVVADLYIIRDERQFQWKVAMFTCSGYYQILGAGFGEILYAPPRSVVGLLSKIACAARG